MNYREGQKVTIKGSDWYNENKTSNGFIVFREGNKVCTFSPGMEKFCGKTFTIQKAVTGSSLYPDHYTFVEDGGSYKWNDEMIAGQADDNAETYSAVAAAPANTAPKPAATPAPKPAATTAKPAPKQETKPAPKEEPKPAAKPAVKEDPKPAPAAAPKEEPKPAPKPAPKEEPKPAPAAAPAAQENASGNKDGGWGSFDEKENPKQDPAPEQPAEEESAFETYTILLKPKNGASLKMCSEQAYKILLSNEIFPSVQFDFNNVEITMRRK